MEHRLRALLGVLIVLLARPAYGYRPFNSTDASVAERGDVELECGPLGYMVDADGRFLVVRSIILNVGVADGWEVVAEGRNFFRVRRVLAERRDTVTESALSLKGILRQGTLQKGHGPSVGLEIGVLLPGIGMDPGVGASVLGVVSQRWSAVTVHANGALPSRMSTPWAAPPAGLSRVPLDGRSVRLVSSCWSRMVAGLCQGSSAGSGKCATNCPSMRAGV